MTSNQTQTKSFTAKLKDTADIKIEQKKNSSGRYIYAVGRRKSAVAQVKLFTKGKGIILVNNKELNKYFPIYELQKVVRAPLKQIGQNDKLNVEVNVRGGGLRGQADSIVLGISRALTILNPNFRKALKKNGFLTRDSRIKERKKPGLKRARRAPQWQKR